MDKYLTPATVAQVIAEFGVAEYYPHATSDTTVEFVLDHDGKNQLIVMSCNVVEGTIVVHYGSVAVNVTSVFNNGSGYCFRAEGTKWESEFLWNNLQEGVVTLNGRDIPTPAGQRRTALLAQAEAKGAADALRAAFPEDVDSFV